MAEFAKIGVVSLGCSKNRIDTELMLGKLNGKYEFVQDLEQADIALINTCAFTNDAKEESINTILEAEQLKKFGNLKGIIVTGCLSQRFKEEFATLVPRVDAFLGTAAYKDIEHTMKAVLEGEKYSHYADLTLPEQALERVVTTTKPTAYVKIAEGCDNCCSYCVIPGIRGPYQSRKKEEILEEIRHLVMEGYSEIILIAQDTTRYGEDLYGKKCLAELMDEAAQIDGIKWLRVLYSYPESITDELLHVMAKHDNIANYIDMPVQHLDDDILRAMNRRDTYASISDTIKRIRAAAPNFIIRSTIIVGFPGTTRDNVKINMDRLQEVQFNRLGVFAYSQEEGTPAAELPDQIDEEEKNFRRDTMLNMQYKISLELNKKRTGEICDVLIEGKDEQNGLYYGRSYAEIPDVDGKILVDTQEELVPGQYYTVKITKAFNYDCLGEIV